jgi:hypothetical protein
MNKKAKATYVNINALVIADDPMPEGRIIASHKYDELFGKLKPGQCLRCESKDVGRISNALRSYIKRLQLGNKVRAVENYGDGKGRVFFLAP